MPNGQTFLVITAAGILLASICSAAFAHEISEWQDTRTIVIEGRENYIFFDTDAVEYDMSFVPDEKKLHFDVYERNETVQGRFRIALPHTLLGGNFTILVDGKDVDFRESQFFNYGYDLENSTTVSDLRFNYSSNAKSIDIIGTCVLPDLGSECTPKGEKKITDPMVIDQETFDMMDVEQQRLQWEKWQKQDKTMIDLVRELHTQYDNKTIQAIVSFEEPIPLPMLEKLLSDYELELQFFNFRLTDDGGGLGSNKIHDFSNLTKIIADSAEWRDAELIGISRMIANGTATNYEELLIADKIGNMTVDEFHILRQIDENMLKGEELKQKLERATEILSELNETMKVQIPWTMVSTSSGQIWYLSVGIDDRLATEPKAVYADRIKKLVGEDIPIVVSFGHVTLT